MPSYKFTPEMDLSEFDYHLPEELIAQQPLPERDASRMLIVDRSTGTWKDCMFRDLPGYLAAGDCLVLNRSKVFPSRLLGVLPGRDSEVEVFLVRPVSAGRRDWLALVRPGKRLRPGVTVSFGEDLKAEILEVRERGERVVRLTPNGDLDLVLEKVGHIPLPPYIHRPDQPADRLRYQTVFAQEAGSVAAPTAGLHFTPAVLEACQAAGAAIAHVTLHVGLGTFQPLESNRVEDNRLHEERYAVTEDNAARLRQARRIVAVGTTSVRTLETLAQETGGLRAASGDTGIFIYPGYSFRAVGAMLTNFHLPKSSLMLLVAAFAGQELILAAYRHAVRERYRFFSYGDCMLIL